MPPRKRGPRRPPAQPETPEAQVDAWGEGPLQMPDGIDAETWIAQSKDETARDVDELLAELTMKPWYGLQSADE